MLEVNLRHALGALELDLQFSAPPGLTVLFGRSGAGKTTVINAVAGLLRPDAGRISVSGRCLMDTERGVFLRPEARRIGYVFQDARLFPHLNVQQNLSYGQWFARHRPPRVDRARVVEMLGLGPLLERRPDALSGGEKSRVAIGRALLAAPDILLADEPLAALDETRKAEILPYFERLRDEMNVPILYVSHAVREVARLATTVVVLDGGRILRQGAAAEVLADPSVLPTGARDAGAFLTAIVQDHDEDGLTTLDASGVPLILPRVAAPVGAVVRVRIAAHDVILARHRPEGLSALNILSGRVQEVRAGDGPGALVVVDTQAGRILARITRRSALALGITPGIAVFAVIKSVSVAPADVGG